MDVHADEEDVQQPTETQLQLLTLREIAESPTHPHQALAVSKLKSKAAELEILTLIIEADMVHKSAQKQQQKKQQQQQQQQRQERPKDFNDTPRPPPRNKERTMK